MVDTKRLYAIHGGLLFISLVQYAWALDNSFYRDDFLCLNLFIEHPGFEAFFKPLNPLPYMHPAAMALLRLEFALFGLNAGYYIGFNILVHLVNATLLLVLLRQLRLRSSEAIVGSSMYLFGFGHYGRQIFWACAVGSLFVVTLVLLAMIAAHRWPALAGQTGQHGMGRRTFLRGALAVGLMTVAPFFHTVGLLAPLLVAGVVVLRGGFRSLLRPALIVGVVTPLLVWAAVFFSIRDLYPLYGERAQVGPRVIIDVFRYLGLALFPVQRPYAPLPQAPAAFETLIDISPYIRTAFASLFAVASVYLLLRGKGTTRLLVCWIFAGLIPFAMIPQSQAWLEVRYLYFASAPLCAVIALALTRGLRSARPVFRAASMICLTAMLIGSVSVVRFFENKSDNEGRLPHNVQTLDAMRSAVAHKQPTDKHSR